MSKDYVDPPWYFKSRSEKGCKNDGNVQKTKTSLTIQ